MIEGKTSDSSFRERYVFPQLKYEICKRILDVSLATIALIMLFPIFLFIIVSMKFSDPKKSVWFRQIRIGKDGIPFLIYKFRTMNPDAHQLWSDMQNDNEIQGKMFKVKNDPRITKLGRILRKTSVDEFPQLWNVLLGNMSLVGPRPPLPLEVDLYNEYEYRRLEVIPGCTGLWQVSGRNLLSFQQMVELDLEYIRKRSIRTDLWILCKTIPALLSRKGAF